MANTKICTKCGTDKALTEFGKHKMTRDLLRPTCRSCDRAYSTMQRANPEYAAREAARYQANRERLLDYKRNYYLENLDKYTERGAVRYAEIKADPVRYRKRLDQCNELSRANPDRGLHYTRIRQARKRSALPAWLSEQDLRAIRALYREARALTEHTGVKHVVDHIVPLTGKEVVKGIKIEVNGLHVPWNLRVITYVANSRKSNKFLGEHKYV